MIAAFREKGKVSAEDELATIAARARAAWPDFDVPADELVAWLRARAGDDAGALAALHAGDLYLACACARGEARALAAFERLLAEAAAHLGADAALADEVRQLLRHRLFVGDDGVPPKIATYGGRGPLAGWLRIAATRAAIDLRRRAQAADPVRAAPPELPAGDGDPELAFLKTHYRRELADAMRETLASLSDRESNVLWLHYYERLGSEAIAASYRVSARTVQRWLDDARARILAGTHARLAERLRLEPSEVRALVALAQSQLDVSIHRLLKPR